jgi:hypothetical protein
MAENKTRESTGDEMSGLPPELDQKQADRISAAAEMGDVMQIKLIAEELKSGSDAMGPFCNRIVRLAEDFDFDGIKEFVSESGS